MRGARGVRQLLVALQHLGQRSSRRFPKHPTTPGGVARDLRVSSWLWHSEDELMSGDMGFSDLKWEPGCLKGL